MTYRVQWTWNGNDINYKDFKTFNKASDFRDTMDERGAGVQRIIEVQNEAKKMKYEIVDMDLCGEKFRRMYIREPMTVHEIYATRREYGFTEEDEVFYSVGITREHGCVPLKMI